MTLPFWSEPENGLYRITVRYAGMNRNDPILNMARCENRPRGGLRENVFENLFREEERNVHKPHIPAVLIA
jgi:hypothetical protein